MFFLLSENYFYKAILVVWLQLFEKKKSKFRLEINIFSYFYFEIAKIVALLFFLLEWLFSIFRNSIFISKKGGSSFWQ